MATLPGGKLIPGHAAVLCHDFHRIVLSAVVHVSIGEVLPTIVTSALG